MRVLITGAAGNLGSKLTAHLQSADWCSAIVGIDPRPLEDAAKLHGIVADLRDPEDTRWTGEVALADAIVHFAAQNPWPDSSWQEAAQSIDMTLNLLNGLGERPCRFVFASSNHVMGGYKDAPLPPGELLSATTPPLPGTRFFDGTTFRHPSAYGSSKLNGERALMARAAASGGKITGVNVRIGWVQPGENLPDTIGPHGGGRCVGPEPTPNEELARALPWYRGMWMSNRDFLQLMTKALTVPATHWPAPAITVSGVSNNRDTAWDHTEGRVYLGYQPLDDVSAVGSTRPDA